MSGCAAAWNFEPCLPRSRVVWLNVNAGAPVDAVIRQLLPLLDEGDIVVDGGNSLYTDTERRDAELAAHGLCFVGAGVSGGEEGARKGPSIMPSGPQAAWARLHPMMQAIIVSYAQGLEFMRTVSEQRGWQLDLGAIARIWRGGCIIRAQFLDCISEAYGGGTALAYYDAYRSARLPANLLQAQRDFFGAHTYERVDRPAGQCFHTAWSEVQG